MIFPGSSHLIADSIQRLQHNPITTLRDIHQDLEAHGVNLAMVTVRKWTRWLIDRGFVLAINRGSNCRGLRWRGSHDRYDRCTRPIRGVRSDISPAEQAGVSVSQGAFSPPTTLHYERGRSVLSTLLAVLTTPLTISFHTPPSVSVSVEGTAPRKKPARWKGKDKRKPKTPAKKSLGKIPNKERQKGLQDSFESMAIDRDRSCGGRLLKGYLEAYKAKTGKVWGEGLSRYQKGRLQDAFVEMINGNPDQHGPGFDQNKVWAAVFDDDWLATTNPEPYALGVITAQWYEVKSRFGTPWGQYGLKGMKRLKRPAQRVSVLTRMKRANA